MNSSLLTMDRVTLNSLGRIFLSVKVCSEMLLMWVGSHSTLILFDWRGNSEPPWKKETISWLIMYFFNEPRNFFTIRNQGGPFSRHTMWIDDEFSKWKGESPFFSKDIFWYFFFTKKKMVLLPNSVSFAGLIHSVLPTGACEILSPFL